MRQNSIGTRLVRHWFLSVLGLVTVIWIALGIAYASGASGVTLKTKYGSNVTLDFGRQYDQPTIQLAPDLGLSLSDQQDGHYTAWLLQLRDSPPVLGALCGGQETAESIAMNIAYRSGDWFYRAPENNSNFKNAWGGNPPQDVVDRTRTVAYNIKTRERVMTSLDADEATQLAELTKRNLSLDESAFLTDAQIGNLPLVDMFREGCMIIHMGAAFVWFLWGAIGGLIALVLFLRRRRS